MRGMRNEWYKRGMLYFFSLFLFTWVTYYCGSILSNFSNSGFCLCFCLLSYSPTHNLHPCVFPGPSTLVCAETLRQEGFTGRIVLVSQESVLPYDRIKLSKVSRSSVWKIVLDSIFWYILLHRYFSIFSTVGVDQGKIFRLSHPINSVRLVKFRTSSTQTYCFLGSLLSFRPNPCPSCVPLCALQFPWSSSFYSF